MRRRTLLRTGGAGIVAATSGCLGGSGTHLARQEYATDPQNLPYPTWGEQVPEVTLSDPITGDEVDTRSVGRTAVYTFFFSHCMSVCPILIGTLRNAQTAVGGTAHEDLVRFLPITFDPQRDDAMRLQQYAAEMNIDLTMGNWSFLRPSGVGQAKAVVTDQFGVIFERTEETDEGYMFAHTALTLVVNADATVERAYRTGSPDESQIIADIETLIG